MWVFCLGHSSKFSTSSPHWVHAKIPSSIPLVFFSGYNKNKGQKLSMYVVGAGSHIKETAMKQFLATLCCSLLITRCSLHIGILTYCRTPVGLHLNRFSRSTCRGGWLLPQMTSKKSMMFHVEPSFRAASIQTTFFTCTPLRNTLSLCTL